MLVPRKQGAVIVTFLSCLVGGWPGRRCSAISPRNYGANRRTIHGLPMPRAASPVSTCNARHIKRSQQRHFLRSPLAFRLAPSRRCPALGQKLGHVTTCISMRGGAVSSAIKLPSAAFLLKLAVAVTAAVTIPCAVNPSFGAKMFGVEAKAGSATAMYVEGIGFVVFSTALVALLSTVAGPLSVAKSIGIGLVPRVFGLLQVKRLFQDQYPDIGPKMKTLIGVAIVYLPCMASLLSDGSLCSWLAPMKAALVVALVSASYGLLMTFRTDKYFEAVDINVKGEDEAKATEMARFLGNNLVVSAVHLGCLASGVNPVTAFGWAAIVSSCFFLYTVGSEAVIKCGGKQSSPLVLMAVVMSCGLRIILGGSE